MLWDGRPWSQHQAQREKALPIRFKRDFYLRIIGCLVIRHQSAYLSVSSLQPISKGSTHTAER